MKKVGAVRSLAGNPDRITLTNYKEGTFCWQVLAGFLSITLRLDSLDSIRYFAPPMASLWLNAAKQCTILRSYV